MRILNLEPDAYSPEAQTMLEQLGQVDNGPLTREKLLSLIADYDVLIVRLGHRIDAEVISKADRLKIIVTATTGLNHIDLKAAEDKTIKVLSLKGEREFLNSITATAEHSWGLLLSLMRHIPAAVADVGHGNWDRDLFKGHEISGKVIGIVGCGRLGRKIAKYAEAFGMHVIINDIRPIEGYELTKLPDLLIQSDIISVHVSYDETTHHLLDADAFAAMKDGAVLINTARGEVIDEAALLENLKNGRLKGAALDVLSGENSGHKDWRKKDALIAYAKNNNNLLITPHIGGATHESMSKTEVFMAQKLKKFIITEKLD